MPQPYVKTIGEDVSRMPEVPKPLRSSESQSGQLLGGTEIGNGGDGSSKKARGDTAGGRR
jgi:hypothetical protein